MIRHFFLSSSSFFLRLDSGRILWENPPRMSALVPGFLGPGDGLFLSQFPPGPPPKEKWSRPQGFHEVVPPLPFSRALPNGIRLIRGTLSCSRVSLIPPSLFHVSEPPGSLRGAQP